MALLHHEPGDEVTVVRRWDGGLTWMAHPDEAMRRASHALVVDGDVWLVDPLDAAGVDEELASLGTVAGVVVLTNSHRRDADRFADRHDVAVHVPACFGDATDRFDAPVEPFADELADTGFELVWEKDGAGWKEGALYHRGRGTLVVADVLMTALFTSEEGRLELFPLFRWSPPRSSLEALDVERVLVGHGEPVFEDAWRALESALGVPRRLVPFAVARSVPTFARIAYANVRS